MRLFLVGFWFFAFACAPEVADNSEKSTQTSGAKDSSDDNDDEEEESTSDDNSSDENSDDTTDTSNLTYGTLAISTKKTGTIVNLVNQELEASNKELDIPQAGKLVLDNSLELLNSDPEYALTSYTFTFSEIKLSETGEKFVDLDLGSNLSVDLLGGSAAISVKVPVGTYKYVYVKVEEFKYKRGDSCEEYTTEKGNLVAVLTTAQESKYLGQDTASIFREATGHTSWDDLQEIFYYKHSSPRDLLEKFDLLQKDDDLVTKAEAKENTSRENLDYQFPDTDDNTNSRCKGGSGQYCNDHLGINTYKLEDGLDVDSYYWLLASEISIAEDEETSLIFAMNPTGDALQAQPCEEAPRDPIFLIGAESDIVDYMVENAKTVSN